MVDTQLDLQRSWFGSQMVDTQLDLQRALLRITDGRYWSRLLQLQQQCDVELLQALLQYKF